MRVQFVKLGGSLITDKRTPETARMDVIERLAFEIARARRAQPGNGLVIGHGSGSFGHVYGQRYGTRTGVSGSAGWYGYCATADAAARLNRIVVRALLKQHIPAWGIQPSVSLRCHNGAIVDGPAETISLALKQGVVPVLHGDVCLDSGLGGTIASTEEIFTWLLPHLQPYRVILAGEIDGIYTSDPAKDPSAKHMTSFTHLDFERRLAELGGSHGVDVTGGMQAKVAEALAWVEVQPQLDVLICSGLHEGALERMLVGMGLDAATRIHADAVS